MTWLKVDDGFYDHPKVDDAPLSAIGLWVRCGSYTANKLLDGRVSRIVVRRLGGRVSDVDALVASGLWLPTADGFVMHDFHDYNPTAEQVRRKREADRRRKARHENEESFP